MGQNREIDRMEAIVGALLIFALRICDVSIGTMRVMFTVRGARGFAAGLGFLEAAIWLLAVRRVFDQVDNWWNVLGYASGFAMGTVVGITIEQWIASGWVLLRVISKEKAPELRHRLRDAHFGVTSVTGEGRSGSNEVLFVVAPRRRGDEALELINNTDEKAFVTIDPVTPARGGYLPLAPPPSGVRK